MPSPHERRRNNIRTGVFVSLSLLAAVLVVAILSNTWESLTLRTRTYTVYYPVSSGVRNLKPDAEVRVGGIAMGEVVEVRPEISDNEVFDRIAVQFSLDRQIKLFGGAQVLVSSPLIGSEAWLDIPSVGEEALGEPPNREIEGTVTLGMLNAVLGSENAARAGDIVANAVEFSDFLASMEDKYQADFAPIAEDVKGASQNIRALSERVNNTDWPKWAAKVDEVMTWAVGFGDSLDMTVEESRGLIRQARGLMDENSDQINLIVSNVNEASVDIKELAAHINTETIGKVDDFLDRGRAGLDEAIAVIESIQEDYEGWSVEVSEALGNATLASQQLKLATIEVRRSPWKVLYRPSTDELEHELLYEAARSFAVAAADMKAAASSTQLILDKYGDRIEADDDRLRHVLENISEPMERYEDAQKRLLDVLFAGGT